MRTGMRQSFEFSCPTLFAQVVVDKNLSDLGESDQLDFKRLRPQIEEAWRSAERGRAKRQDSKTLFGMA